MQNLQIRYQESSAHLEYLEQYSLIQEEDVQRHSIEDSLQYQGQFQFRETVADDSSSCEAATFEEFMDRILNINQTNLFKRYSKILKGLSIIFFGDLLEYCYIINNHNQIKPLQLLNTFKWDIFFHLLTIFLFLALARIQGIVIILFVLSYFALRQTVCQSQVFIASTFKSSFNSLLNKLKHAYLHSGMPKKQSMNKLNHFLKQFVKQIQNLYGLQLNETPFIIDKISGLLHCLYEKIKNNNYSYQLLSNSSLIKRKYYFWMLKDQNKRLKRIQEVFMEIIEQFDMINAQKQVKYIKPLPKKTIYFHILMFKYHQFIDKSSQKVHYSLPDRNLLKIIRNQIQFKQIFNIHKRRLIFQAIQQKNEIQAETNEVPHFFEQARLQTDSYYYEDDDTISKYEPQSLENIKGKLNNIFKARQEKQQRQEKPTLKTELLQRSSSQKIEKSIFSFGIPILPPKRDMQAYYIE